MNKKLMWVVGGLVMLIVVMLILEKEGFNWKRHRY